MKGMIIRPKLRDSERRQIQIEQLRATLSRMNTRPLTFSARAF